VGSTRSTIGIRRTVEEHQAVVAGLIARTPVEQRELADTLAAVLAEDLRAATPLPPFDNSAMDGYAVRAADLDGAAAASPVELPVEQDIPAGRTDIPPLKPGTAHRIMTGAQIPDGADAVVPVERTDGGVDRVRMEAVPAAGDYVRVAGEDAAAGTVLIPAGTVLTPPRIGVAAAVGASTLPVRRAPRVLVLSTGSELVAPGTPLLPGQIYESNGPMLAAAVRDAGGAAELLRFVRDDVEAFSATLAGRLDGVDLVITSGGVSAGAYEVVKDALAGRGVEFVSVAMQPGGPQGAGRLDGVPVVTLPGNPVSSQVSFEVFLRPALRAAYGHPYPARPVVRARLAEPLDSPAGKRQFRRGALDAVSGTVRAVGGPGSHLLSALARADCLIVVPEHITHAEPGDAMEIWLLEG
jgi:molybdopterin molybdotransferase